MNRITQASLLSFAIALSACGGGGAESTDSAAVPASASNIATSTPAAANSSAGTPAASESPSAAATPASATVTKPASSLETAATSAAPAMSSAAPATAQSSSPVTSATSCGIPNFQQEILNRINAARANSRMCGDTYYSAAGPLTWNDKLFAAGVGHATDMGNKNYFAHTSQDGRTFDERITQAGYVWNAVGENIAAGQSALDQVLNDWLKSPGHCVNIMNDNYAEVGVTCVSNSASTYKNYWAMELGHAK